MTQTENFYDSINKAFIFATEKHSGQFRKGTKIPYIVHLYEVTQILKEEKGFELKY